MNRSNICWHCFHGTSQVAAARRLASDIGPIHFSRKFSGATRPHHPSPPRLHEAHLSGRPASFRGSLNDAFFPARNIKTEEKPNNISTGVSASQVDGSIKRTPHGDSRKERKLGNGDRKSVRGHWLMPNTETELKAIIGKSKSPLEMWHRIMATEAFQSPSIPQSVEITLQRSPELRKAFIMFIRDSLHSSSSSLPPLETILKTFLDRGFFRYQMLWHVLEETRSQLVNAVFGPLASLPEEEDSKEALRLLAAIINTWQLALRPLSAPFTTYTSAPNSAWTGLPTGYELEGALRKFSDYFERFVTIFPGRVDSRLEKALASDSAWVYLCFEDLKRRDIIPDALLQSWKPWTDLIERLVAPTRLANPRYLRRILNHTSKPFDQNFVSAVIQQDRHNPHQQKNPDLEDSIESSLEQYVIIDGHKYLGAGSFRSRLTHASRKGHYGRAIDLWYEFTSSTRKSDSTKNYRSAVIAEFIWYFARCRQPDRAFQAWQLLDKSSISPLPAHWTGLVEAARSGGSAMLQEVWPIMCRSGQPPNQAWTAYVTALFKLKAGDHALAAVAAMGRQWESRPKPENEDVSLYGPSIIPINAAISGLLARHQLEPIEALLSLANKHELKPTTDTYNIFLRHAVKEQDSRRMSEILKEMKQRGCECDVVTITLVIDSLLRHPDSPLRSVGALEQEKAIDQSFADLASAGLEPSAQTYTTLVKALLDEAEPQLSAVQAILQRMERQGIHDNSYAYTTLIGHYFARNPPDIPAIERIMKAAGDKRLRLDAGFYDRLTRGFAEAGHYEQMLAALRQLDACGKPTLRMASAALAFLVQQGDLETARQLVLKVEREVLDPNVALNRRDQEDRHRWSRIVQDLRASGLVPAATANFRRVRLSSSSLGREAAGAERRD